MNRSLLAICILITLSFACRATAQSSVLTNEDVLRMAKAGLSPGVIVEKISREPCRFDTSTETLTNLKSAGIDDSVLTAMIRCHPVPSAHNTPHVWVGANEEWVASNTTLTTTNFTGTTSVETSGSKATVQTHSEYPDVTRELTDKCQGLVITNDPKDADYAIAVERYHAGHLMTQRNTFSIFRARDGTLVSSGKTTWLKNAANDMCRTILHDSEK